jgi:hypothetical protein
VILKRNVTTFDKSNISAYGDSRRLEVRDNLTLGLQETGDDPMFFLLVHNLWCILMWQANEI